MSRIEHLAELEAKLYAAVPPIDPPYPHWLTSDSSASYCRPCIKKARLAEMGLEAWPVKPDCFTWERTTEQEAAVKLAEELEEGIDGGFDCSPSDIPESCDTCGRTLDHTLTEYGVEEELAHFAEHPGFEVFDAEQSYVVSRICLNLTWSGADPAKVEAAIKIVTDALIAVVEGKVR